MKAKNEAETGRDTKGKCLKGNGMSSSGKVVFIVFLSSFLLITGKAIGPAEEGPTAPRIPGQIKPTRERLLRGRAIYNYYCSPCHGLKGNGQGPNAGRLSRRPRNFTDKPYMATKTDRDLHQIVEGGGSAVSLSYLMPPWGATLTEQERFDIIVYIRTFEKQEQFK